MKRFAYPTLISVLALAVVPGASVLWFRLGESPIMAIEGEPYPCCTVGLRTLLWPGVLLARVGMHHAWLVGVLCLLGLAALLVWVAVRLARRKIGWLLVLGFSVVVSVLYCAIGTMARLTPVPLPVTTRYDSDPPPRSTFERCWEAAYRRGEQGLWQTWCFRPEPETHGYERGQRAGLRAWHRLLGMDDSMGLTPLMWAIVDGDEGEVARLLSEGADVNARAASGRTPLMFAVTNGPATRSMVALLIRGGADVNAATKDGYTPLMLAAGQREPFELLLKSGADIKARTRDGTTALLLTALAGSVPVAELLIAAGADIHDEDKNGETPLMKAAWRNDTEMVIFLLGQGADVNHRDKCGQTPLCVAVSSGFLQKSDTIRVLLEHGASVQVRDNEGRSLSDLVHPADRASVDKILGPWRASGAPPPGPPQSVPPGR